MWSTASSLARLTAWLLAATTLGGGLATAQGVEFSATERSRIASLSPLPAPPPDPTNAVADDPAAARLGQRLFFDTRLSANGEVACASCHRPEHGFADPQALSEGIGTTRRHAPTLLNVGHQQWLFWDGRADSLWAQALGPMEASHEHGTSRLELAHLLHDDAALRNAYRQLFGPMPALEDADRFPAEARPVPGNPDHPHQRDWDAMAAVDRQAVNRVAVNAAKAIAAYQRRLLTGTTPFDRFARGLQTGDAEALAALSPAAQRGLKLFVGRANCVTCHFGPDFSDGEFHNLGLPSRPWLPAEDLGRFAGVAAVKSSPFNARGTHSDAPDSEQAAEVRFLARQQENRGQFKTPPLRGVARTPPYMHGGHFETLEEVVRFYSELPGATAVGHREHTLQPLDLTDREVADLVAFLKSLTGPDLPRALTRDPAAGAQRADSGR